ncbi:MAG TPA: ABC transporter permease [Thermoanaerobaculia bacterium]|nr:ABC transporter permease [Thermoanaerobaculia bacterium]
MRDLWQDLRFALRTISRHPGYAAVAALTLALGVGANTAVFSVVDAVLLAPLPYPEADELVLVWENDRLRETEREGASYPDLVDWRESSSAFSGLAAWRSQDVALTGGDGEPERLSAGLASAELFAVLGAGDGGAFAAGRPFRDDEDRAGAEPVAVLSHGLWQRRFDADPGVVGSALRLDGTAHTVVGVAPEGFDFPTGTDLWVPFEMAQAGTLDVRGVHNLLVVGRLAPGTSVTAAQSEMTAVMERLEREHLEDNQGRGAFVEPLGEATTGDVRPALLMLFGAVALVLLVACVNVANLVLARAQGRGREMAVRGSLGAGRWRLARLVVVESLVLALVGGAAGCLVAFWGVEAILAAAPDLPRLDEVHLDGRVIGFGLALSLLAGLAAGMAPLGAAFGRDLTRNLKSGDPGGGDLRRRRLRQGLVAAEVALSVALAIGAGLLLRSLGTLLAEDPGFRSEGVLSLELSLPGSDYPFPASFDDYPDWPSAIAFYPAVLERVTAVPGVSAAALAHQGPLDGGWTTRIALSDRPAPPPGERDEIVLRPVTDDYFRALDVPLVAGRGFDRRDRAGAPDTLIVNHAFVERYFPGQPENAPLGVRLEFWGRQREIVGVVGDVRFQGLGEATPPAMYPPLAQVPQGSLSLLVRTSLDPIALAPTVRQAVWDLDPNLALFDVATLDQALGESVSRPRFQTLLVSLFAAVALLLAAIGLYGVMAALVAQRTREIGIRMALGADRSEVVKTVLGRGLVLTLGATALGLAGAWALARLLGGLLYGISPGDPLVFTAVPALLALVALAACWLPARRASRIDPLTAIRHE